MRILRQVLDSVIAHARQTSPRECCGILLAEARDPSMVSCALWVENAEKEHPESRYVLAHKAHLRAVEMEASGVVGIVGYYHSHPNGKAEPSPLDAELAVEGTIYLVVGVRRRAAECSAWRLEGDELVPEPVEVIGRGGASDAEAS